MSDRGGVRLPLLPCLCMGLATLVFSMSLLSSNLPIGDDHTVGFVATHARKPQHQARKTQLQARKFTARDRGTPEYEAYMAERKKETEASWDQFRPGSMISEQNDEKFQTALLGAPAPAPAPAAPQATAQKSVSAPAPASAGGNPFQFIADIFNPTTTTTTTTTTAPPDPITAFFQSLR